MPGSYKRRRRAAMTRVDRLVLATLLLLLVLAFGALVAGPAMAHAPWTCRHGHASHLTTFAVHEVRFERGFRRGGNHYHVYSYWVWRYGVGWDYRDRLTRLCNGTH